MEEEISRCFKCGTCTQCDLCFLICPDLSIWKAGKDGYTSGKIIARDAGFVFRTCPGQVIEMKGRPMKQLLSGNYAVAEAVRLARVQFVAAYPITPQTPIYEKLSEMENQGTLTGDDDADRIGAFGHGGLHLGLPDRCAHLHGHGLQGIGPDARDAPFRLRKPGAGRDGQCEPRAGRPLGLRERPVGQPFPEGHGWMQFYCEDGQEALDTVIQAYKIAEAVFLPVMVCIDGFFTSHFIEPLELPDQASVDAFLPRVNIPNGLTSITRPTFPTWSALLSLCNTGKRVLKIWKSQSP